MSETDMNVDHDLCFFSLSQEESEQCEERIQKNS